MGSGYAVKAAVKRPAETSAYGTEATGITGMIPLLNEDIVNTPQLAVSEAVVGRSSTDSIDLLAFLPGGNLNTELWFEHLEPLFFAALGYECPNQPATRNPAGSDLGGSPAPNDGTPESFLHIFEPDTNLHREAWASGERAASGSGDYVWTGADQKVRTVSLALEKNLGSPSVLHWVDCMVNKMTIRGAVGDKALSCSFEMIPRHGTMVGTSSAWVLPTYRPRPAVFPGLKLYVTQLQDTLATEVPISEFELTVDNGLKGDEFDSGGNDLVNGLTYRSEPKREKPRVTTLKLKFARMKTDTALVKTYYDAGIEVQARLVVTGPAISGSAYPYQYVFALPQCKFVDANFPVAGPGIIEGSAELRAYKPAAAAWARSWLLDVFGGVLRQKKEELVIALTNTKGGCYSRDRNTTYPLP